MYLFDCLSIVLCINRLDDHICNHWPITYERLQVTSLLDCRYIVLYETITGTQIQLPGTKEPVHDRISRNVQQALLQLQ
jgi:hypothetical protein